MAAQITSFLTRRILKENVQNSFGQEDPYFEEVPASRLGRAFGKKTRKRRKAVPPGLSTNDAKVLNRVKRRAYRLEYSLFNMCGIRFGWGAVIGLVPFAGDGLDAALAMMVLRECEKVDGGLPNYLRVRMLFNVALDFVIGLVPFVGDLADAIYKCNTRNAILLEKHLREKANKPDKARLKQGRNAAGRNQLPHDPSLPEIFDSYDKEDERPLPEPPSYTEAPLSERAAIQHGVAQRVPAEPQPARTAPSSRQNNGWFGGKKQKRGDLESGAGTRR